MTETTNDYLSLLRDVMAMHTDAELRVLMSTYAGQADTSEGARAKVDAINRVLSERAGRH